MKYISPIETKTWKKLEKHYQATKDIHLKTLFENDKDRFEKFSLNTESLFIDFSKNKINEETLGLLLELAVEMELPEAIESMFSGEKNKSNRASGGLAYCVTKFLGQSRNGIRPGCDAFGTKGEKANENF